MKKMGFYEEIGAAAYINAHDTYTVYGGSRMAPETLSAMAEAAASFVDMEELQTCLGSAAAKLTRNEAAYFCNGASGGLLTAAAVCMARGDAYRFARLPAIAPGTRSEAVVLHCQHNAYDKAIEAAGATVISVGDADETLAFDLEGALNERTAAVFYFASSLYARAALPLEEVIRIAHTKGVPVVVDAAAQLPPPENLWRFPQMGADLVIFSGGKTLCGPQDSGLIVGRKDLISDCVRFGAPAHGVCRSCKTSRESMAGLYTALKRYLSVDQEANTQRLNEICHQFAVVLEQGGARTEIVPYGPVGQTYPRIFGYLDGNRNAEKIWQAMREKRIYIGLERNLNAVYLSPLNLRESECAEVARALEDCLKEGSVQAP